MPEILATVLGLFGEKSVFSKIMQCLFLLILVVKNKMYCHQKWLYHWQLPDPMHFWLDNVTTILITMVEITIILLIIMIIIIIMMIRRRRRRRRNNNVIVITTTTTTTRIIIIIIIIM